MGPATGGLGLHGHYVTGTSYVECRYLHNLPGDEAAYVDTATHLSPGVSLISDLVHDSGILQSELFTSRSQNLVLGKLRRSGFWN